jgi:hypothetical protein
MFLPLNVSGPRIETRIARFLSISPTGRIIENMRWLGLFDEEPSGCKGDTAAVLLQELLERRLPLAPDMKDMVLLLHELEVDYPGQDRPGERITSTLVVEGEPGGFTAMAKTVGLPAALAVRLALCEDLRLRGSQIPTHPSIYTPILKGLAREGIAFDERVMPLA